MKKFIFIILILVAVCLSIYGIFIEPNLLEVKHIWIEDLKFGGDGLKGSIGVHISDLHMDDIGKREKMVLDNIDDIKPDFIFLTGDYVKWGGDYEPALDFLSMLKARSGIWGVMGDYDYSNSRKSCLFCHEPGSGNFTKRHSVKFLRNSITILQYKDANFSIGGIDVSEENNLKATPDILLSHSPLEFDKIDNSRNVLMLSGDTHGGQVPVPSWLWKLLGYKKNAKYIHGLYQAGKKKMYVSRGIGTSHVPIRIFRRPEIVVLHF